MVQVLVVDDEAIVCQGIKELLEASELGISQVLTACNGYEALDYIRMEHIDLVLTDIQMDGMNGIELMESIMSEKPDIPVIVITAHDEFEYAQRCIRLGARDFLIKPVMLSQLLSVVSRELSQRHEKYRLVLEESLKLKFSMTAMLSLRSYILNELISEPLAHADDYRTILEQLELSLTGPYYSIFALELQWEDAEARPEQVRTLRDRNLLKYAAVNIIEETLAKWRALAFYGAGSRIVAIIQATEADDSDQFSDSAAKLNMLGRMLTDNIRLYLHIPAAVGISPLQRGTESLTDGYRRATEAVKRSGLYPHHHVFYSEDFLKPGSGDLINWQEKTDRFVQIIQTRKLDSESRQAAVSLLNDDLAPLFGSSEASSVLVFSIAYRVYAALITRMDRIGDRCAALDPLAFFGGSPSGSESKTRLSEFLSLAADLLQISLADQDEALVEQAIGYIRASFRQKGLKIQDIASHVFISPNYLSYLFKQHKSATIWEFVTKLRMEEARHLLLNTNKKRYEIAEEVGYESPEHFSRVFKRFFGESPNMLRS
ncbi:response regulator transcription factor [Gorillibacterium massiliense]|uniref:response regulator transcription factor n=1 Tax=Gorillibacterium massiliense TaxID=1280390 RepID=UPI0004BB27FE|nr:response regulator [Gorillibacterium massiliense]